MTLALASILNNQSLGLCGKYVLCQLIRMCQDLWRCEPKIHHLLKKLSLDHWLLPKLKLSIYIWQQHSWQIGLLICSWHHSHISSFPPSCHLTCLTAVSSGLPGDNSCQEGNQVSVVVLFSHKPCLLLGDICFLWSLRTILAITSSVENSYVPLQTCVLSAELTVTPALLPCETVYVDLKESKNAAIVHILRHRIFFLLWFKLHLISVPENG